MMHYRWKLAAVLAVLSIGGTAIAPASASAQDSTAKPKPPEKVKRGGSNFITESEIGSVSEDNAYDVMFSDDLETCCLGVGERMNKHVGCVLTESGFGVDPCC